MPWNTQLSDSGVQMINSAVGGDKLIIDGCVATFLFDSLPDEDVNVRVDFTVEKKNSHIQIHLDLSNSYLAEKFSTLTGFDPGELVFESPENVKLKSATVYARLESMDALDLSKTLCHVDADEESYIPVLPPSAGYSSLIFDIPIAVSNTANISVKIDDSIHVTAAQFQETVNDLKARIDALTARVDALESLSESTPEAPEETPPDDDNP